MNISGINANIKGHNQAFSPAIFDDMRDGLLSCSLDRLKDLSFNFPFNLTAFQNTVVSQGVCIKSTVPSKAEVYPSKLIDFNGFRRIQFYLGLHCYEINFSRLKIQYSD